MGNLWNREPAMILGLLQSGLALYVGFGGHLTGEQIGLLMACSAALLGLITRSQVTPMKG